MATKTILKIIAIFVIGMIGGIFADQILWPYFIENTLFSQYKLEKNPISVVEKKETIIQENAALTEAIEKQENVVMAVRSQTSSGIIEGSGLIVTADGLVVTLAELVPKDSVFSFFVNGETVSFQILKRDLNKNLALVKLEISNMPIAQFADSSSIKLGERVFLIGEALNRKETSKLANEGIIRKVDSSLIETNISEKNYLKGSSLFNIKGEVLGINTINSEGKIVSIPISIIKEFIGL